MTEPFKPDFHFSLVCVARCEIQAMDQHWSLHRLAIALPGGELDEPLARDLAFNQAAVSGTPIEWPKPDPTHWRKILQPALEKEVAGELDKVRLRQENSLRRELERIDDYFANYRLELASRDRRGSSETSKLKTTDRLAAAKAEHERRRADQLARHEIRVHPHLDALLMVAEKAWRARPRVERGRETKMLEALFVPRARRWEMVPQAPTG